ncbi:MAG: RHS repeat domain-containing protein [Armatimonadota bacterium]|nr:RHS repeat domain-containing protein [Armatimonadota bacterium]MDR7456456.1 RHS repeat domain-containing protein [Armatimonadota bacterium]MDR7496866.1 RHS repeat domain-containing protein [Armatimonadota bacterium]MDR7512645.1 RHS repeat domain-containing protein [Armatimonadota bacterium]
MGLVYASQDIVPGLIEEARDANANVTTYTWTTFPNQIHAYIATIRDPVNWTTTYAYERSYEVCVQEGPQGQCQATRWHYRVRAVTDPWGRTATYTYTAQGQLASVTNGAGRTTSYTYEPLLARRLLSVTTARGHTTALQWSTLANAGRITRVTAPDGSVTTYSYTIQGTGIGTTVVTNARGHATTYLMDTNPDEDYQWGG